MGDLSRYGGLRFSAAFWTSKQEGIGWERFLFSERAFVNKWLESDNKTGAALSCRFVKAID